MVRIQASGDEAMRVAQDLFSQMDIDASASLDPPELAPLVQTFCDQLGISAADPAQVDAQVAALLEKFDFDRDGALNFSEWLSMLVTPPWLELFDEGLRDAMSKLSHDRAPLSPRGMDLLGQCELIFSEADLAHRRFIGIAEMEVLAETCWRLGGGDGGDVASERELESQASLAVAQCGSALPRGVEFLQFITLLSEHPWAVLLPPHCRVHTDAFRRLAASPCLAKRHKPVSASIKAHLVLGIV